MPGTFEQMLDYQIAQQAGVENPQHIEREYDKSLEGLMELFLPPYRVIRMVDEAGILIPPPPEPVVAFLERTLSEQGGSVEAKNWLRKAREAVEAAKVEDVERDPETRRWLQRVKAARPALKAKRP